MKGIVIGDGIVFMDTYAQWQLLTQWVDSRILSTI